MTGNTNEKAVKQWNPDGKYGRPGSILREDMLSGELTGETITVILYV